MTTRGIYVILAAMAAATWAAAQQPQSPPASPASSPAAATSRLAASSSALARDPTEAPARLKTYLGSPGAPRAAVDRAAWPRITKRAFVQVGSQPPEAIIDVDGAGTMTIRAGSTITIATRTGEAITAEITRLSADEIEFQVAATGQKITLR